MEAGSLNLSASSWLLNCNGGLQHVQRGSKRRPDPRTFLNLALSFLFNCKVVGCCSMLNSVAEMEAGSWNLFTTQLQWRATVCGTLWREWWPYPRTYLHPFYLLLEMAGCSMRNIVVGVEAGSWNLFLPPNHYSIVMAGCSMRNNVAGMEEGPWKLSSTSSSSSILIFNNESEKDKENYYYYLLLLNISQ
jgi:hypothetical protein